jgi:voltage-gated potassium channel
MLAAIRSLTSHYLRFRYACLFVSLLLTAVAAPVLAAMGVRSACIEAFVLLSFLTAVFSTGSSRSMKVPLALLVLVVLARIGSTLFGLEGLLPASQGIGVGVCLVSALAALHFILRKGEVTAERIFAALSLYLLIGLVFAILLFIVQELQTASPAFHWSAAFGTESPQLSHLIYFSFVTLGTLGYGDIVPISGPARSLAVVEALIGQMYLAVVIARLVALYRGSDESNAGSN